MHFFPSRHSLDNPLAKGLYSLYELVWVQGANPFVNKTNQVPPLVDPDDIPDQDNVSVKGGLFSFRSIELNGDAILPIDKSRMFVRGVYDKIYSAISNHSVVLGQPGIGLYLNSGPSNFP